MINMVFRGVHVETLEETLGWFRENFGIDEPIGTNLIRRKYNEEMPKVSTHAIGAVMGALGYVLMNGGGSWIMKKVYEFERENVE